MNGLSEKILYIFFCFAFLTVLSCSKNENQKDEKQINKRSYKLSDFRKLNRLNTKLGIPKPGDWLFFKDEPGQTFEAYINSNPVVPSEYRKNIYILPIGEFNETEHYVLKETAVFMNIFFGLDVILKKPVSSSIIPKSAQRIHWGTKQFYTKYILKEVLYKNLPKDAVVYIAVTSDDLYPADDWNFVFGQANIKKRIGVSSVHRLTYDSLNNTNYQLFLKRIAETTAHESCHMFSMLHCTEYKCMMNGSMHLEEADSKPLHLCPECLAKLIWCTGRNVNQRFNKLTAFFKKHNFTKEAEYCKNAEQIFEKIK